MVGIMVVRIAIVFFMCSSIIHAFSIPFFSSSSTSSSPSQGSSKDGVVSVPAEFTMQKYDDPKARKLVENAMRKLDNSNSCWQKAYRNLFSSCATIISDKDKQSRLAWHLSSCFQMDSGRSEFPRCNEGNSMVTCLRKLDDMEHKIYLEFFLETNAICHQLQTDAFKHDTERLVNELSQSARFAEEKLTIIEEKSEQLLQDSNQVQDSLASIDHQTSKLSEAASGVESQINDVLEHSKAIFEQSKGISAHQQELQEVQHDMKMKLESSMASLHESYKSLDHGIHGLRQEAEEIEKEIKVVGDSMSSKMVELQTKTDDIGTVAGLSLEKQQQLLSVQNLALEGLDSLKKSHTEAIEESRTSIEKIAEITLKRQQELLKSHEQIQEVHQGLIQNFQTIMAAQEQFGLKQAGIFAALDKLYILHNALLIESRLIKSFFFYACMIFLLYMLTSARQTFNIRARLYLCLCTTFMIEIIIVRYISDDLDQQSRTLSKLSLLRYLFLISAAAQILHSIFTFRDYERMNHQLLQTLVEKVGLIEENAENMYSDDDDDDCSLSKYSWICEELPEDVDSKVDPDYMLLLPEEVGENSISTASKSYNLRPRRRR